MNYGRLQSDELARLVRKAHWYGNRLRAMSAGEVAHRLAEQARRTRHRWGLPASVRRFEPGERPLPVWPGLVEGVGALARDGSLVAAWATHAKEVEAGRFDFLGVEWPVGATVGGTPDWHLDPATGRRWPADTYCFDIRYRDAEDHGDVKNVWELSKLQYLQPVAAYARVAEDEGAAALCRRHLLSWIEANPPYRGVHWASGVEIAFRTFSMLIVTTLLGEGFTAAERRRIVASLYQHGWWLHRFPSLFSSANNHLVAEAAGLFALGELMPDLPQAERWRGYGRRILEREATRQLYEDGIGAEQSPAYAALTLEWLLLAGDLARRLGQPFGSAFWARIGRAGEALKWFTDAAGHQPRIGDDDESRVVANGMAPEATINSVLAAIAGTLGRPELSPPVPVRHLRHALLPAPRPDVLWPAGLRHFPEGGYTVQRHRGPEAPDHLLVFDHGPVGFLSIAAHGHADTLAIWLHVAGRPVLIDAGTYLYHAGHAWRDHVRSTAAHNTLTLAGENSSEIVGPFNWGRKAEARVLAFDSADRHWSVVAEHDGYWESHRVRHRRAITRETASRYRIVDRVIGRIGVNRVEVGFLVSPEFRVDAISGGFVVCDEGKAVLRLTHDGPLAGWVETGRLNPRRGWHSPRFGVRKPAPRIVFAGEIATDREAVFILELNATAS